MKNYGQIEMKLEEAVRKIKRADYEIIEGLDGVHRKIAELVKKKGEREASNEN